MNYSLESNYRVPIFTKLEIFTSSFYSNSVKKNYAKNPYAIGANRISISLSKSKTKYFAFFLRKQKEVRFPCAICRDGGEGIVCILS